MILLTSTSDLLQVITASAVTTINVHASYVDYNGTSVTPARLNSNITGATTTSVVGSPASSTQRNVKSVTIHNSHATSSNLITVQHTDGTTVVPLFVYTLLAGETIEYFDEMGFRVLDAGGNLKTVQASQPGRLLGVFVHTSGTTHTTGASTNTIKVRLQAGGGAGGGGASTASDAAAGGGGGGGGYAEKTFAVAPSTGYTYAVGAGGTAGTAGNNAGNTGGASTFAVGATTVTANGGNGGAGMAAATTAGTVSAGGAPPSISTNGDVNASGASGEGSYRTSGTVARSGKGADSQFGGGGTEVAAQGTGVTGIGFGSGGSGGCTLNGGAATAGGAGAPGIVIVEEYS